MQRMTMMVCPHDTAKDPERWFLFSQYLSQRAGHLVHFEQSLDFPEFQSKMAQADLIYANPQHTLKLFDEHGFIPLTRAASLFDEAVLVTCAECEATVADFHQASVATVPSMLVTQVALKSLARSGIAPQSLQPASTWMGVVQAIYNGEARFGILYKDFYEGMSKLSRKQVRVVSETAERSVYHCFMLAPRHADHVDALRKVMLGMADDERGAAILRDLHMDRL
ncbi:MAG: phosphate/phosphite/phosphonate ABC transporter substrate-binding protein, partial [Halothiobacillaceae bacterium]